MYVLEIVFQHSVLDRWKLHKEGASPVINEYMQRGINNYTSYKNCKNCIKIYLDKLIIAYIILKNSHKGPHTYLQIHINMKMYKELSGKMKKK